MDVSIESGMPPFLPAAREPARCWGCLAPRCLSRRPLVLGSMLKPVQCRGGRASERGERSSVAAFTPAWMCSSDFGVMGVTEVSPWVFSMLFRGNPLAAEKVQSRTGRSYI